MLIYLPSIFNSKVSYLEERHDLSTIEMDELHGILTTYETRISSDPSKKEETFKEAKKNKKKVETKTNNHEDTKEDVEDKKIVKNLRRCIGKHQDKIPLK